VSGGRTTQAQLPLDILALSRRLHRFLWSPPIFARLAPYGCGWNDGGCRILAEALVAWLGPAAAIAFVCTADGEVEHVVALVGPWVLDGDGISPRSSFLDLWGRREGIAAAHLALFDAAVLEGSPIPADAALSRALAAALATRFPADSILAQLR
jgi:hypothetical protein